MSALGQKQTFAAQLGMSALSPKADMRSAARYVRFVPIADIRSGLLWQPLRYCPARPEPSVGANRTRCSLAQKSGIESRIASPGDGTFSGCQASENIALTRDDVLAALRRISITHAHNIVGPCNASCGKFFLVLLQALEHVVRLDGHAVAPFFKFLTAR